MTTQLLLGLHEQGERIRKARAWTGLSQKEMADEVSRLVGEGISHNTISQIEKGVVDPRGRVLWAIGRVTGQDQAWLQGDPDAHFRENKVFRENKAFRNNILGLLARPIPQAAAA